ncbi:MAG: hypothetical protein AB7V26_15275 [Lysobacterales bacterium]
MHSNGNGENGVAVPAGLVEQLQNMASKGEDSMQCAPGAPGPTPQPQIQDHSSRTDD